MSTRIRIALISAAITASLVLPAVADAGFRVGPT
jgi:hypothetical protein